MPETSPDPLPRLLWLHRSLHEAPQRSMSAKALDEQYDAWGLERKTKGRDLAALAGWAGPGPAALRYDRSRRTWILERSFEVPQGLRPRLPVSDATAQVLQLSQLILQATQGDGARAVDLLDDLVRGLPDRIRHATVFAPARLGMDDAGVSRTWSLLHGAISRRQRVEYRYGAARSWRRVDPLHLWWAQGGWYLLARLSHKPERLFSVALSRMEEVIPAVREGRKGNVDDLYPATKFDPRGWLGQGDWLYRGGESRTARIRFDARAVPAFRDRLWQPDSRWEDAPDGAAILHLDYPGSENGEWEMARKVLGWGEYCTVEGPPGLVRRVREMAATIARRHGG